MTKSMNHQNDVGRDFEDTQERINLLEKKQLNLQDRLRAINQDIGNQLDRDSTEQAIELENREVLLEIARVTAEDLDKVKRQLQALT